MQDASHTRKTIVNPPHRDHHAPRGEHSRPLLPQPRRHPNVFPLDPVNILSGGVPRVLQHLARWHANELTP